MASSRPLVTNDACDGDDARHVCDGGVVVHDDGDDDDGGWSGVTTLDADDATTAALAAAGCTSNGLLFAAPSLGKYFFARRDGDTPMAITSVVAELLRGVDGDDEARMRRVGQMLHRFGGVELMVRLVFAVVHDEDGRGRLLQLWDCTSIVSTAAVR